jgi:RNA polymerase sigma-70 factor (ECF subfamily)
MFDAMISGLRRVIHVPQAIRPRHATTNKECHVNGESSAIGPAIPMRDMMLRAVPELRAFAISLCGNRDRAADLVQETLTRAWARIDTFRPGSMIAWLTAILRNLFYSEYRKRRREVADSDGIHTESLAVAAAQTSAVELGDLLGALAKLTPQKREALILVGAAGFSYDEAAAICGCAVGTIKSRVNRARTILAQDLLQTGTIAACRTN